MMGQVLNALKIGKVAMNIFRFGRKLTKKSKTAKTLRTCVVIIVAVISFISVSEMLKLIGRAK